MIGWRIDGVEVACGARVMLLTVKEAADKLRISLSKCYDLCAAGKLAHYKIDGSIRVSEQQLADFLKNNKVEERLVAPPLKHLIPPSSR